VVSLQTIMRSRETISSRKIRWEYFRPSTVTTSASDGGQESGRATTMAARHTSIAFRSTTLQTDFDPASPLAGRGRSGNTGSPLNKYELTGTTPRALPTNSAALSGATSFSSLPTTRAHAPPRASPPATSPSPLSLNATRLQPRPTCRQRQRPLLRPTPNAGAGVSRNVGRSLHECLSQWRYPQSRVVSSRAASASVHSLAERRRRPVLHVGQLQDRPRR
jgi:hypothetical protein